MNRACSLLLLALLCALPSVAQTSLPSPSEQVPSDDASWQRYLHILRTSTLEWVDSEPFLLEVEYQLYDLDGRPTVSGTAEESWTETDGKQIRIQSSSLVIGDEPPTDRYAIYTRESYLVHQALGALARPFPSGTQRKDFAMDRFTQTIANSDFDCFSLIPPQGKRTPSTPAYCTDPDNRIVAMVGPLFLLERSDFRKLRGHEIPMDLKLSYEGKLALTMHVAELDPLPHVPVARSKTKAGPEPSRVAGETIVGMAIKRKDPKYPAEAKIKRISGSVIIAAIITREGKIADMEVIASPDPLLTKSALDGVKSWTYRPYILNGAPVEIETTITVNYAFGK